MNKIFSIHMLLITVFFFRNNVIFPMSLSSKKEINNEINKGINQFYNSNNYNNNYNKKHNKKHKTLSRKEYAKAERLKKKKDFYELYGEIQGQRHQNDYNSSNVIEKAKKLLEIASNATEETKTLSILGKLYKKDNNLAKAEKYFRKSFNSCRAIKPFKEKVVFNKEKIVFNKEKAVFNLVDLYLFEFHDGDKAIQYLQPFINETIGMREHFRAYAKLINAYSHEKLYLEAEIVFEEAIKELDNLKKNKFIHEKMLLYTARGDLYNERKDIDKAHEQFKIAYDLNNDNNFKNLDLEHGFVFNDNIKLYVKLAKSFIAKADFVEAEKIFMEGIEYFQDRRPNNVSCHSIVPLYSELAQLYLICPNPNHKKCISQDECNKHLNHGEIVLKQYIDDSNTTFSYHWQEFYLNYAKLLERQDKLTEALVYLEKGLKAARRKNNESEINKFESAIAKIKTNK